MLSNSCLWPALLLLLTSIITCCNGARILGIFPIPGKSHHIVVSSLMRELASRGHQLTVISAFPQEPPLPNYTDIVVENTLHELGKSDFFALGDLNVATMLLSMWGFGVASCDKIIQQSSIQNLIHSKDKQYDLIIIEAFFNDCFLGFAHKFKAPLVGICAFGGTHWMGHMVGNPNPYAYVPDPFLNYGDKMNFWDRMHNTLVGTLTILARNLYYLPQQDAIIKRYFNDSTMPSLADLEKSTALLLVNNHVSLSYPRPLLPNLVQVGGLHIKPPKKLPKDLETFLDGASEGVIYFSMGSNLKSADMPEYKRQAFLNTFSKLKQKVLWKWEADTLPGQPPNVRLGKWLPQPDILAHKNVRLFITHGGLMSTQEAIYHGVPLVGIPIYGDQRLNMGRAKEAGYGLQVDYNNVSEEALLWAIQEVINTPSYKENAKRLSSIYRDQPQTPMELAVYWTEYVIKHKGAQHLRSAALDLAWYQYLLLDIIAAIAGIAAVGLLIACLALRVVYRKLVAKLGATKEGKTRASKKKAKGE